MRAREAQSTVRFPLVIQSCLVRLPCQSTSGASVPSKRKEEKESESEGKEEGRGGAERRNTKKLTHIHTIKKELLLTLSFFLEEGCKHSTESETG